MIELDCKLTRDGHVVALHDQTLGRLWGIPRPVGALDWEEVRSVRVNSYRVPALAEVLSLVPVPVMVDLPGPDVAEAALEVAR